MAKQPDVRKSLRHTNNARGDTSVEFNHTEQNTDGSLMARHERMYRNVGLDVTPTFSVAAEFDEIVRVVAFNFPAGVAATLQFVIGCHSGEDFSDVVHEGIPVVVSADDTIITIPFSGRFRFLFKGGWPEEARIGIVRQERIPTEDFGFGGELDWQPTGLLDCRAEGLFQQEVNQHGRFRWVNTGRDCGWQSTGELQCRVDGLYERQRNEAGDFRWIRLATDCQWVPTGERQCRTDHRVWQLERNRAGDFRWTQTSDVCGYDPTYPLPCGGWAFGPGDVRDPAATVELTDCVDDVGQGIWLYPAAGPGHTVPVYDCTADFYCLEPDDIEGYASNTTITGVRNMCYDGTACGCNHNHAD